METSTDQMWTAGHEGRLQVRAEMEVDKPEQVLFSSTPESSAQLCHKEMPAMCGPLHGAGRRPLLVAGGHGEGPLCWGGSSHTCAGQEEEEEEEGKKKKMEGGRRLCEENDHTPRKKMPITSGKYGASQKNPQISPGRR